MSKGQQNKSNYGRLQRCDIFSKNMRKNSHSLVRQFDYLSGQNRLLFLNRRRIKPYIDVRRIWQIRSDDHLKK